MYTCCLLLLLVVSNSLWPHGLQNSRLPCPSPSPGVCSNSCPLSQWCHPTITCFVSPFSSCPQSFPASGSFPMSQLHIRWPKYRASASVSVLLMNILGWFPLGLTGLVSLQSKGLLRVFSTVQKHQPSSKPQFKSINSLVLSLLYGPILTSIPDYWKTHSFD